MFVRTKFNKERGRYSVQIVKSVRENGAVRQRVVRHVGVSPNLAGVEPLKELGRTLVAEMKMVDVPRQELLSVKGYACLFAHSQYARREGQLGVDLGECREQSRVTVGIREVYGRMWEVLGLGRLMGVGQQTDGQVLREMVLSRIAQPHDTGATLSFDRVYEVMDGIDDELVSKINQLTVRDSRKAKVESVGVSSFDLDFKGQPKVRVEVAISDTGLPLSYEMFEGTSPRQDLSQWQERFPDSVVQWVEDVREVREAFELNSLDLRVFPLDEFSVSQVRAHLAICYLALTCVRGLAFRLGQLGYQMTPQEVLRELNALQMSILWHEGSEREFVMPSGATIRAKQIYRCVGLDWQEGVFKLPK